MTPAPRDRKSSPKNPSDSIPPSGGGVPFLASRVPVSASRVPVPASQVPVNRVPSPPPIHDEGPLKSCSQKTNFTHLVYIFSE